MLGFERSCIATAEKFGKMPSVGKRTEAVKDEIGECTGNYMERMLFGKVNSCFSDLFGAF